MAGLKDLWDLGDAATLDPGVLQQIAPGKQAFLDALSQLNESLQYTAANAPQGSHAPLVQRRDELLEIYQQTVADASGDVEALEPVVARVTEMVEEAGRLVETTRDLKARWEREASTLASTEDAIASVPDESNGDVADLQNRLGRVAAAAKDRDYETAIHELGAVAGAARSLSSASTEPTPAPASGVNERRYPLDGPLSQTPGVPPDPSQLENWQNPFIDGDPRELFKPERMDEVADMHFVNEGSDELNAAMEGVLFAKPGADVSGHLEAIGKLRGLDASTVQRQFERFRQLQDVARQNEAARGLDSDDVMTEAGTGEYLEKYGDFLGSRSSLRFGQVIGEATGLDPAFAAMLNPTGGMVGPGMDILAPTDANSPVILHGIFHDAGGYLLNYQNSGPGYTYLKHMQPESGRRGSDPFQGQVEGVSYWYERRAPERSVLKDLFEFEFTSADPEQKQFAYDRYVKHPIEDAEALADGLTEDAVSQVREMTTELQRYNRETVGSLQNSTHAAGDAIQSQVDQAQQSLDRLADQARSMGVDDDAVETAQEAIRDRLESVNSQVEAWENGVVGAFDAAGQVVEDNLVGVNQWADESGEAIRQWTAAGAEEAEKAIHDQLVQIAQDKAIVDSVRNTLNTILETKQDVEAIVEVVDQQLEQAKRRAEEFYQGAADLLEEPVGAAAEKLTGLKNSLIDKLADAQATATTAASQLRDEVDGAAARLGAAGQDILDAAGGVTDSMADAVSAGTDVFANTAGTATEFAAESLDSLTNLLG